MNLTRIIASCLTTPDDVIRPSGSYVSILSIKSRASNIRISVNDETKF